MSTVLIIVAVAILAVIAVVLYRTATFKTQTVDKNAKGFTTDKEYKEEIEHLSQALQIKTVSRTCYDNQDFQPYEDFIKFLHDTYPKFHEVTDFTRINGYGLVYTWHGKDKTKLPLLFLGHYDVVPVEPGTENDWSHPCFSGEVAEGRIWGRGALDDKHQVISLIEAAQALMHEGFEPERDIYFAFGNDEEIGGLNGAGHITKYFEENGMRFEAVYDECGFIATNAMSGVNCRVAQIGIAEKGYADIKITAVGQGGHAAIPPKETALKNLSKAMIAIHDKPMKPHISGPAGYMINNLAGEKGFVFKMMVANQWLFKNALINKVISVPQDSPMLKTTMVPTICKVGSSSNVLPQKAEAILNARMAPGDTSKDLVDHLKKITGNWLSDIEVIGVREPSQISPVDTKGYDKLTENIRKFFPDAIVTPYLVVGGSDSRKYYNVCDNIYRFTPFIVNDLEMGMFHNTNESIPVDVYKCMIEFYKSFMTNFDK